jgi:ABC-2 type transport system permease protein
MKRFLGFIIKEFHHIFRDKRTLLVLFGLPIIQMLLFGYLITNELRDVRIAVLDHSKDRVTREITEKLTASGYFIIEKNLRSEKEIEACLREGVIREVVVFEPGFERRLEREGKASVQVITDASEANSANMMYNYTAGIIRDHVAKMNRANASSMQIIPVTRMVYNESLEGAYMFVPGTMAMILMLISALLTSVSIAREKEMGTMEVLLVSPLKPVQIILGKVVPYVLLSLVNAICIIALGYFVFGLPMAGSLTLLMAECMLFILMALSLGIMISSITSSQQVAMFISLLGLMFPTILLSGFIFPIENMPRVLQWLCYILPPTHFIVIIKNIMLKGVGIEYVWKDTLYLAGITIFFIAVSAKKFKLRLDKPVKRKLIFRKKK